MKIGTKRKAKWIIFISILFILLAYFQAVIPEETANFWNLTAFWLSFKLGLIFLFDEISFLLEGVSLFHEIIKNSRNLLSFIAVGITGGFVLDGVAQWLGKLWIYPYWSNLIYVLAFGIGFTIYWLLIAESYLAAKAILKKFLPHKKIRTEFPFEQKLFRTFGIVSIPLIIGGILLILQEYKEFGGYEFNIQSPVDFQISFLYVLLIFFGTWFLLEFIEYSEKKTSLIKDILHNYEVPLLSILLSSFFLALFMETVNIFHDYWLYTNWPFSELTLFGLPITMFLAWPLHYIIFLSLFRALTGPESKEIWN